MVIKLVTLSPCISRVEGLNLICRSLYVLLMLVVFPLGILVSPQSKDMRGGLIVVSCLFLACNLECVCTVGVSVTCDGLAPHSGYI